MHQQLRKKKRKRGRSHQRTQITETQGGSQEAFNVFGLVNEGRASYGACHAVSLSLFNLVTGGTQTAAQIKRQSSKRKKNLLSCPSNSFKTYQSKEWTAGEKKGGLNLGSIQCKGLWTSLWDWPGVATIRPEWPEWAAVQKVWSQTYVCL